MISSFNIYMQGAQKLLLGNMLPSEETTLMTTRILCRSVTEQLERQPGGHNILVSAWNLTKEQRGY